MNKSGPIIIIDDDLEDQELMKEAFAELSIEHEIVLFSDSQKALDFMTTTAVEPFLIFSDVNMPKQSGMELRQQLRGQPSIRVNGVPFLFLTTSADLRAVTAAYGDSVQGFFIKPSTFSGIKKLLQTIVAYWQNCVTPE